MELAHLNEEQWLEMLDLLEEDFVPLIKDYVADCHKHLASIKTAHGNNDNEAALDAAHTLKGASANIGAEVLAKHCATMQTVCQQKMLDNAFNVIADIETEMAIVLPLIEEKLLIL